MSVRLPLAALVGFACLAASPAFAEAIIYRVMIGKNPVLLELSQPIESATPKIVGRYFYASNGIDIPLEGVSVKGGKIALNEEQPCTAKICHNPPDGQQPKPPIGARWTIDVEAGGAGLTGSWTNARTHRSLPIDGTLIDARQLPADFDGTPQGLTSIIDGLVAGENALTTLNSPYDFFKFDEAKYTKSPPKKIGNSTYSDWVDPRTKFAFPRIVDIGGADVSAANVYLAQQQDLESSVAFSCESQVYQGFGWLEGEDSSVGTLANVDESSFDVTYLSPTIMSWTDAGSEFCAEAHPNDHVDYDNLDVRTGKPLDLSLIFADWVPTPTDDSAPKDLASARAKPADYTWGADKKLQDFVLAHVEKPASDDDSDCTSPDTIASNLDISFKGDDQVIFAIDRMNFADADCDEDLFTMPIAALKPYLTPQAVDYFPSLKQ